MSSLMYPSTRGDLSPIQIIQAGTVVSFIFSFAVIVDSSFDELQTIQCFTMLLCHSAYYCYSLNLLHIDILLYAVGFCLLSKC